MTDPVETFLLEQMKAKEEGVQVPSIEPPSLSQDPIEKALLHEMALRQHETPSQMALTALESGAKGILGPVAPLAEQVLYEAGFEELAPEKRRLREEASPNLALGSEAATFLGGAVAGVGLPAVLGKAGTVGLKAVEKVAPIITSSKIGSRAVQGFIENGIFQTGNEVTKLINQDPNQSAQSAIVNIGLMGAIGGGLTGGASVVSSLWKRTAGLRLGGALEAISNKLGGIEGKITDPVAELVFRAGLQLEPEVIGSLNENPVIRDIALNLLQTNKSSSGLKLQETFQNSLDEVGNHFARLLGIEPGKIPAKFDKYRNGYLLGEKLAQEAQEIIGPKVKLYEEVKQKIGETPLSIPGIYDVIQSAQESIVKLAQDKNWVAVPSSDIMKEWRRVLRGLPHAKDLNGFNEWVKSINVEIRKALRNGNSEFAYQAGLIIDELEKAEANAIEGYLYASLPEGAQSKLSFARKLESLEPSIMKGKGKKGEAPKTKLQESLSPQSLEALSVSFQNARKEYAEVASIIRPIADQLGLKGSISGFPKNVREMAKDDGEILLRRLFGKTRAETLQEISKDFPQSSQILRNAHIEEILSDARIEGTDRINPFKVNKSLSDLSPQLEAFVTQGNSQFKNTGEFLAKVKDLYKNYNWSNTGRRIEAQKHHDTTAAIGLASWLLGHGPLDSVLHGILGTYVLKEAPDAAKLALLKWLGSSKESNPGAFKAAVEFIHQTIKGENLIKDAAKGVFEIGKTVLPDHLLIKNDELESLDKRIKDLGINEKTLEKLGDLTSYYMPDHAFSVVQSVAQAASYVNQNRPKAMKLGPLDDEIEPSSLQKQEFKNLLRIANQPLVILEHLKKGTLTTQDLTHLTSMYPSLYGNIRKKLQSEMLDYLSEGKKIPYQTRFGLSLFFGQPLDSSFSPQSILSNQQVFSLPSDLPNSQKTQPKSVKQGRIKEASRLSLEPSDSGK